MRRKLGYIGHLKPQTSLLRISKSQLQRVYISTNGSSTKQYLDEECSKLAYEKQTKLQWLQDPSQINSDNVNNAGVKQTFREQTEGIFET